LEHGAGGYTPRTLLATCAPLLDRPRRQASPAATASMRPAPALSSSVWPSEHAQPLGPGVTFGTSGGGAAAAAPGGFSGEGSPDTTKLAKKYGCAVALCASSDRWTSCSDALLAPPL